ncbi:MAG: bifunctional DNA-formamidopyrimidine glycosylase/DNA-(apurinic or apyrimidinic site) lyase [Acidobacteriota bacterium]
MPELPEVETLRRSLARYLPKDRIVQTEVLSPALREPLEEESLRHHTEGRRVEALGRRSKYLLIHLSGDSTLVIHLGMSGRVTISDGPAEPLPHEHLAFRLESGRRLRLQDPRRFGQAFALPTAELDHHRRFVHLGPEPLGGSFGGETLLAAAKGRRGPVKNFLMDAKVVVGVGNIYASEALHRAGIHPKRSVARISSARFERLAGAVRETLAEAVEQGGTTLNDFADADGQAGYFQISLAVYGREGEPCSQCSGTVRRVVQGQRSTFYCSSCQT